MKRTQTRWLFVVTVCLVGSGTPLARDKTDIVHFKNGDRLTCEIRELASGRLRVKTNGLGTVEIEWSVRCSEAATTKPRFRSPVFPAAAGSRTNRSSK